MSRMHTVALSGILLLSTILLASCSSTPDESPLIEPTQNEIPATPQTEMVVETAPEARSNPLVVADQTEATRAPQPPTKPEVVQKPKRKVVRRVPTAPIAAPEPRLVVLPESAVVQSPKPVTRPQIIGATEQEPAPMGFFEEYWLWLLVLAMAIGISIWWKKRSD